jgi:ATP-binding protein involved in chromosome partitioning
MPDNGEVWRRLKTVPYPGYRCDIVSFGLVREVRVEDPAATIVLAIGHLDDATATAITDGVRSAATAAGVTSITLRITRPEQGRPRFARSSVGDVNDIPRGSIERILVVASGKGGVGKSTVAVNLAVALASQGLCTGLLEPTRTVPTCRGCSCSATAYR